MEFKNHKIIEAVCAFRFNPPENNWDITSYAGYPQMVEGAIQMVIRNEKEDQAILLGNNYISFHTINHYPGWEIFSDHLISIYLQKYFEIGYGKGLS